MTTYKRPGTYVEEVLLTQNTPVNNTVAVSCFLQSATRGPIVPTRLTSWQDAVKLFGGFTGTPAKDVLLQAIYDSLNNGSRVVYATRVVGSGAAASTITLNSSAGANNEIQTITITGGPTGGTFALTYGSQTTPGIAYNATAATIRAALAALSSVGGAGNVAVSGSVGGPFSVTFQGTLADTNVGSITADGALLTGGTSPAVAATTATAGTPGSAALTVTALNPGVWGDNVYVEILPGSSSDRFSIVVREVPTGAAISNQQIVERFVDLSLNPVDSRNALGIVNSTTGGGSVYIEIALDGGYTYTSGDTVLPSTVSGGTALAGGADGGSVGTTQLQSALPLLDAISQPFVLNVPGATANALVTSLANYADPSRTRDDVSEPGRGDVFVVVDCAAGVDGDSAISTASAYPTSDFVAVYYPQLVVADPSSGVPGATKLVPPGPAVVGRFIATDAARGVFKAPAGTTDGKLVGVVALDPAFVQRNAILDRLNEANVNAIKVIPNVGPCIFGARTLKSTFVTRYVSARRTLIAARAELIDVTSYAPFENNDSILWSGLANRADKVCRELFAAGGLKGNSPEQAYYVKCDSDNNTLSSVQAGEVHLEVGLAVQRPAEFVVLTIAQFEGGSTVIEDATNAA